MTTDEIAAAKVIYQGPSNSQGRIFPGFPVGNEGDLRSWKRSIAGSGDRLGPNLPNVQYALAHSFFRYLAFPENDDDSFGLHDFDLADYHTLEPIGRILNATDTDLRQFARKGKIIYWQGWSDATITALGTIEYFESLSGGPSADVEDFARLYLAPGVQHCGGGEGPSEFDMLTQLENWVERGIPPVEVIAVRRDSPGAVDIARPLCPYPQIARPIGPALSPTEASNFECVQP
jgi:feruloyl esterase